MKKVSVNVQYKGTNLGDTEYDAFESYEELLKENGEGGILKTFNSFLEKKAIAAFRISKTRKPSEFAQFKSALKDNAEAQVLFNELLTRLGIRKTQEAAS